ncbi:MAG: ParB/RepB/Spo0J family partition protein, partial [Pseudomonadota bacterium]
MANKRKSLGRGLGALLGDAAKAQTTAAAGAPAATGTSTASAGVAELPIDLLQRGRYQPRVDMRQDTLDELAASIKAQGIVQPIAVRPIAGAGQEQRYEIIAGERRWRAAQLAGLSVVPTIVHDVDDNAAVAMALIENIQREDLNPLEEARALARLIQEFELTHQEGADA